MPRFIFTDKGKEKYLQEIMAEILPPRPGAGSTNDRATLVTNQSTRLALKLMAKNLRVQLQDMHTILLRVGLLTIVEAHKRGRFKQLMEDIKMPLTDPDITPYKSPSTRPNHRSSSETP